MNFKNLAAVIFPVNYTIETGSRGCYMGVILNPFELSPWAEKVNLQSKGNECRPLGPLLLVLDRRRWVLMHIFCINVLYQCLFTLSVLVCINNACLYLYYVYMQENISRQFEYPDDTEVFNGAAQNVAVTSVCLHYALTNVKPLSLFLAPVPSHRYCLYKSNNNK